MKTTMRMWRKVKTKVLRNDNEDVKIVILRMMRKVAMRMLRMVIMKMLRNVQAWRFPGLPMNSRSRGRKSMGESACCSVRWAEVMRWNPAYLNVHPCLVPYNPKIHVDSYGKLIGINLKEEIFNKFVSYYLMLTLRISNISKSMLMWVILDLLGLSRLL